MCMHYLFRKKFVKIDKKKINLQNISAEHFYYAFLIKFFIVINFQLLQNNFFLKINWSTLVHV